MNEYNLSSSLLDYHQKNKKNNKKHLQHRSELESEILH